MEHKQGSSNSGRKQRPNRRRRRRRRRSPATGNGPAPAANRRPAAAAGDNAPAGAAARKRPPQTAAPPDRRPRETAREHAGEPAPGATAAEAADGGLGCPVCGQPVRDLYTAIAYGERKAPAHFDCILALLGEREELEEGTRVCYLGGGCFGIVDTGLLSRQGDRGGAAWIRKRIEVEERDATPGWREVLRLPLPEPRVAVAASEEA